jgi:3-oxoacyl-[acyl-carrier protein] reductase
MGILKDKVALVTGSSRGIGAAVAKIFAREGAKVAIHGRDETALSRVAKEIECTGGHVTLVVADVTKFAQIEAARRQIERELGPVELLVANAGGSFTSPGPIEDAAGRRPHPRSPIAYSVAKAGIELLTQDVAAQAGPYLVRVNCIAPETILPERNEQRIPDEQRSVLVEAHPIKRLGTPDDVANAALFLASENSSWITGVILDVAGGAVMVR